MTALVTRTDRAADRVPPEALVLAGATSIQFGAALAATLFDEAGPGGTVVLRLAFAAVVLLAIWRPWRAATPAASSGSSRSSASTLGVMNLTFYEALDRIPLGVAVTIEFLGPIAVAVAGSRRALDLALGGARGDRHPAAGGGVARRGLDTLGVVFALVAGAVLGALHPAAARGSARSSPAAAGWRSRWSGRRRSRSCPGIAEAGPTCCRRSCWPPASAVALASLGHPLLARDRGAAADAARVFGVLMSLEPALAALAGFLVLGQDLGARR